MARRPELAGSQEARPEPRALASELAAAAGEKGATDVVLLEVGDLVTYTDCLLICTARNERMAGAIADEVRMRLKRGRGLLPQGSDGAAAGGWLIMDYLDCVLHVFTPDARERYQLEDLWREAPRVVLEEPGEAGGG